MEESSSPSTVGEDVNDVVNPIRSAQRSVPLEWTGPMAPWTLRQIQLMMKDLKVNGRPLKDVLLSRPGVPKREHYAALRALAGIEDDGPPYSEGDLENG